MDSGAWIEVKQIFAAALACPPADRASLLDERCRGSAFIRGEVETLLEAHTNATGFLEQPAIASSSWLIDLQPSTLEQRRIGPFRLAGSIGAGGMGVVYRAERVEGGFDQQVAIKIIDLALHDPEALSRFAVERQILASLNHPNIVQFIDGGQTPEGQAFIVMELIDGVRVTNYCRERTLPLDDRLRLIEQICGAVQYAHQHGVVHRDLKPGNILVSADGAVKVLDFGVAKLIASSGDAEATRTGMLRPLTPDYASPEQLRGLPVTTASDIYALGVLTYEVVTGRKPYETSRETLDRILEIVTITEPPRPSQALAREPTGTPYDGTRVRGDLDAIILKAMHKDPARRYASAQELATDLARYRGSEPVIAREPSLGYVIRKAARRHRAAATAAAVSVVAVLAALGVSIWQTQRVAAERDRAKARFDDARQIANALIFKVHDGIVPLPGSTPVRKMIVDEALTYLERLSQDPSVDDALRLELAAAYRRIGDVQGLPGTANLGDRAGARTSLERAAALLDPLVRATPPSQEATRLLISVEFELAATMAALGDGEAAVRVTKTAAARAEALVKNGANDDATRSLLGRSYFELARASPHAERLPHWQRAADVFEGLLKEQPADPVRQRSVALTAKSMGAYFENVSEFEKARAYYLRAQEIDEQRLAARPLARDALFDVAIDVGNVANVDSRLGRAKEAGEGFERSLALRQKLAAQDPQDVQARDRVAFMHGRLARLYARNNRPADALSHARKAVATIEPVAGVEVQSRQDLLEHLIDLAELEAVARNQPEACRLFRRSRTMADELLKVKGANLSELETFRKRVDTGLTKCGG